nr:tetratricopeptide repeat protein [Wolbachia pipientis]
MTRSNMAGVLCNQGNYSEALRILRKVLDIKKAKLGSDHPSTLLTNRHIEIVSTKQASGSSIQFYQKQQKAHLHLSQFVSRNLQNASIESVKQGLYLPSFEARNVKINGKCTAITRGLSQALLSQGGESFLSNLKTSTEIYERIVQGKQASKREERKVFAFSKLLDDFEQQLDSTTNSLPSSLIHTKGYKTLGDLSSYIAVVKGDFAIHLVTSNHVVAIYRTGDNYAYFDCNAAFVSGLKNVDQLMKVVEKGIKSAGYKVEKEGLLVEYFDVEQANKLLSNEDKQILAKEIKTERQLLAEQDKKLGLIKVNGQEISRIQLYDFGTKIHVGGSVPLLINADMNLSSKKFQDHLDKKEISMTAREYLGRLKSSKNVEEVIQATRFIPFEGSRREIEKAEQTRKLKGFSLEQLVKGTINSILAAVSLANISRSESQLLGKIDNKPETYLNDLVADKQLQSSISCSELSV